MKNIYHFIGTFLIFFTTSVSGQGLVTEQAPLPCLNKTFTIVAHIVRDTFGMDGVTQEEIQAGIDTLNMAFEPICTKFEICEYNYIDDFQYDIIGENDWDEMQVKYNKDFRINMYFVGGIENPYCGFATLNGVTTTMSGGLVILKECIGLGATMPHEMGHFFGLRHTFEGNGSELVDGSNCDTEGDLICDTPADPFVEEEDVALYVSVSDGCRFISNKVDANGEFYSPDVGNYMSYYPAECGCGFTYQQYLRMANNYLSAPFLW